MKLFAVAVLLTSAQAIMVEQREEEDAMLETEEEYNWKGLANKAKSLFGEQEAI